MLISTLVLTIGMIAIAALLGVTTEMQISAREAARSTRLAQAKIDELMKLDFDDDKVAVGGDLDDDVLDHAETPLDPDLAGITLRWLVADGPIGNTRVLTVRVTNVHTQRYRQTDMATIIRQ